MAKIFISYSRKDKVFAGKLSEVLEKKGLETWVDWENIPPTADWMDQIHKGIESADGFLFLLSPDSVKSEVCGREIDHAAQNGKRLIPVVVRDVNPNEVHPALAKINWIYCREQDIFDEAVEKLLSAIHTDLDWVEAHRKLQVKALEWNQRKDNSRLLRGRELHDAEETLASAGQKDPQPTDLQRIYLLASRRGEIRTRNILLAVGAVVMVALALLSIFAINQRNTATNNAATALANQNIAQTAQADALHQKATAVANENIAQTAQANAQEQRATAVANELEAKRQAGIAFARQLSAQAQVVFSAGYQKQTTAILLAVQSMRMFPSLEAAQILQNADLAYSIIRTTHNGGVTAVAFSADGKYVVSVNDDHTIHVWDAATGEDISLMTLDSWVYSVAFSPDSKYVVSGSADNTARVWEAATGKEIALMTHDNTVGFRPVEFSPDGKYVVSGGDNTARVWEATTGKEIARMTHTFSIRVVVFSPDGKYVASGGSDNTARVWESTTGKEIARMMHGSDVNAIAFSPDGKYVVSGSSDNTARAWEATTGKETARMIHDDDVDSVAFSLDGMYVVSGSVDGTARVWEANTGKEISRMTHDKKVWSVAFSPDGRYVASGSADGTARVWEASTGKETIYMNHDGDVKSVSFSSNGKYILSNGGTTTRVWIWRPDDLIAETCSHLTRNITLNEWSQYIGNSLPYQAVCPNLALDLKYIKTIAKNALSNPNDPIRIITALNQVRAELAKDETVNDPTAESLGIVSAVVTDQILAEADSGGIKNALDLFDQARQAKIQISFSDLNGLNNLCWLGSLQGYEDQVLQYCDSAVKLAPLDADFRDSRGLARALTGDFEGAILDFQYFVDQETKTGNGLSNNVKLRQQWIMDLKTGKSPFTPEVLNTLTNELSN